MLIRITEPITDQYTLILESDMIAIETQMHSKAMMRWDFNVIRVEKDKVEARLILLNHELLETNSPFVQEVAEVTKVFSKMYDEIHVIISHSGKVLKVVNLDIIIGKWNGIKAEMQKQVEASPDLQNIIQLNDSIFSDPQKVALAIESNEFFISYFGRIYGSDIPFANSRSQGPNFLNTTQLPWTQKAFFAVDRPVDNTLHIAAERMPDIALDRHFCRQAYSQFADKIDMNNLHPVMHEKAEYKIDAGKGNLISANMLKTERAQQNLYLTISYTLMNSKTYAAQASGKQQALAV